MNTKYRRVTMYLTLAVVLTGCGPFSRAARSAAEAKAALSAGDQLLAHSKNVDDLTAATRKLQEVPRNKYSAEDWATRERLIGRLDAAVVTLAVDEADRAAVEAKQIAETRAASIVRQFVAGQDTGSEDWQKFDAAFERVTGNSVKDAACGTILNLVAPDQRPPDAKGSTDQDQLVEWALDGFEKATPGYSRQTVQRYIDLYKWAKSVVSDGEQVVSAVSSSPQEYLQLASRPPVQRAAVLYLRYCYSPPRMP